jgi:hypothetical protein
MVKDVVRSQPLGLLSATSDLALRSRGQPHGCDLLYIRVISALSFVQAFPTLPRPHTFSPWGSRTHSVCANQRESIRLRRPRVVDTTDGWGLQGRLHTSHCNHIVCRESQILRFCSLPPPASLGLTTPDLNVFQVLSKTQQLPSWTSPQTRCTSKLTSPARMRLSHKSWAMSSCCKATRLCSYRRPLQIPMVSQNRACVPSRARQHTCQLSKPH